MDCFPLSVELERERVVVRRGNGGEKKKGRGERRGDRTREREEVGEREEK